MIRTFGMELSTFRLEDAWRGPIDAVRLPRAIMHEAPPPRKRSMRATASQPDGLIAGAPGGMVPDRYSRGGAAMLNKILCAIDGSDHAEKAAQWASALAQKFGAELILLFVVPHRLAPPELRRMAEAEHVVRRTAPAAPPVSPQPGLPSQWPSEDLGEAAASSAAIYQELGERLVEAVGWQAESAGVARITKLVEDGDPAHRIVEAARRENVDLIVMGRRGLGDLKGLLLGSVTHKVAQAATCACLTVE
jgi:nucleotide-binding universal stress UspA family protein